MCSDERFVRHWCSNELAIVCFSLCVRRANCSSRRRRVCGGACEQDDDFDGGFGRGGSIVCGDGGKGRVIWGNAAADGMAAARPLAAWRIVRR
eukprot:3497083-Pleurochrysis_carterae.AAC.1